MACSFSHTLLAAAVALVVGGSALAQGQLKEAVTKIRLGQTEEAKTILREILAADLSNTDALQLYQSVSQDEWYLLVTEQDGDVRKIAQSILERAKVERKARSRDEGAIQQLVDAATAKDGDYGTRQEAINKLVADHGEFAVPALVQKLANSDDAEGQIKAIAALQQLGTVAVLPLVEALKSSNELLVQNAAAALYHIGDLRAAPAMAHVANDSRVAISEIGKRFLTKAGVTGGDVELLLGQARKYLKGEVPVGAFSDVVWRLQDDKLVPTDVPALVYAAELAKSCAADAVAIAPQSADAISMLAQANLAQASLIEASIAQGDETAQKLAAVVPDLKIAAQATGLKALRMALDAGMSEGVVPVATGAIDALAMSEAQDTVGQSSRIKALDSTDKRIAYAAANAMVRASHGVQVPAADKVVGVLASAVTEEAVRTIQVISPASETAAATQVASGTRGNAAEASASAVDGMQKILRNPSLDVLVINDVLPDRNPEDIIGLVRKDSRMANLRIVIVAKDPEAAKTRFGDNVNGVIQAPLSGEALVAEVNRVLEGVTTPAGVRGEAFAVGASESLLALAAGKANVGGALANVQKQLDRADALAVPAAKTLGLAGGAAELGELTKALAGSSDAVKVAAADAIGQILSRVDGCPEDVVAGLMAAVQGGGSVELRTAAAMALGKAKLEAQKKGEVQMKLRKIAGVAAEG